MPKIIVSKSFEKYFEDIPWNMKKSVIEKMKLLWEESEFLDIKKIEPKQLWRYRLRIWKYRLIYKYLNQNEIELLKIDSRDSIYR